MKKAIGGVVLIAGLLVVTLGFVATPAQAAISCVHPNAWYRHDPSRIGGPDLTPDLEAAILARTHAPSLAAIMTGRIYAPRAWIAVKPLITAASNGSNGDAGFTGTVGDAFYALVQYYQQGTSLTRLQLTLYAITLQSYNSGNAGIPSCT